MTTRDAYDRTFPALAAPAGPPVDGWEPDGAIREGCAEHIGGARGLCLWLRYAESLIDRDPEHVRYRIAVCDARNAAANQLNDPTVDWS